MRSRCAQAWTRLSETRIPRSRRDRTTLRSRCAHSGNRSLVASKLPCLDAQNPGNHFCARNENTDVDAQNPQEEFWASTANTAKYGPHESDVSSTQPQT